jgi:hypothetical protein
MNSNPKYRWPLNRDQLEVLNLLHKFRFGSSDLIAQCFGKKNGAFVYKRLKILQEQGFIGKRFDGDYRIKGMPAAYYLLPDGMRKLNEARLANGRDPLPVERLYKEKSVSDGFVQYCLDVFDVYCHLKTELGDSLHFFTRGQLTKYDYFSEFVPSVYVRHVTSGTEKDYFLEYLQSSKPFFTVIQRLKQYIEYANSGEWEAETNSEFPKILLICDKPSMQNRLLKKAESILEDADDELKFYIATHADFKRGSDVWRNLSDADDILYLTRDKPGTA